MHELKGENNTLNFQYNSKPCCFRHHFESCLTIRYLQCWQSTLADAFPATSCQNRTSGNKKSDWQILKLSRESTKRSISLMNGVVPSKFMRCHFFHNGLSSSWIRMWYINGIWCKSNNNSNLLTILTMVYYVLKVVLKLTHKPCRVHIFGVLIISIVICLSLGEEKSLWFNVFLEQS